jgi:NAD(P)-dependent dehydrogenase (short-subunit alcohol dehydrogenase family)
MTTPKSPHNESSLEGKVCLVTGGTRGIGRAIAEMLLEEGASVAICGRRQDSVDEAVRQMGQQSGRNDKVKGKAADVKNHEEVGELFRFIDQNFGKLDVLVNNAGVGVFAPVRELGVEQWRLTIETNLSGVFYCSREALFRLGTNGAGYIVTISSLAGKNAFAGGAAYNASKFALTGFSEAMMQDVRSQNVRVSYIMPGSVATSFGGNADDVSDWKIQPDDVAEIVRMLLKMPVRTLVSCVEVRPSKPRKQG